ncbi:hypothetical protein C8F04DRAFT_1103133 [Mycena alexandri]|uniref:Uncharacterized protein n=1 Tax=Mycena alexandri TaxID=1745969 RepID=A0AAD6STQ3_9AGAR|nr:hypothetical protein C8F04DRAFT_1103133 [Mycena alexandri]
MSQPTVPYVHDWGAPGIRHLPEAPPSHNQRPGRHPLPWHGLQFNPLGVFDLRRLQGIFGHNPSIWNTYRRRFEAGDIAWLASGASEDNCHEPEANGFFPEFKACRDSLPNTPAGYSSRMDFQKATKKIIWDLATMLDRTFGSTTMILNVGGTTVPGSPALPEFLRASVYLPPAFLRQHPDSHPAIAQIAQIFLESVGVPTVVAWKASALRLGWTLTASSETIRANSVPHHLFIPPPVQEGSSHFVFKGRPAGTLRLPTTPPGSRPSSPASPTSTRYGSEEPLSAEALELLAATERIYGLEQEVDLMRGLLDTATAEHLSTIQELGQVQAQLNGANIREEGYDEERRQFQQEISSLQTQLSPAIYAPPRYTASPLATPTRRRAGAPSLASPSKASTSTSAGFALPSATQFLEDNGLQYMLVVIRVMVKYAPSTKWYLELAEMDLDEGVADGLLECLTQDCM